MIELTFEEDPYPDVTLIEDLASWGSLKIWANGFNLCTHYDSGELRQSVNWNWWTLLQWLEASWDSLFHEQALPIRNAADWAAEAIVKINRPETFEVNGLWNEKASQAADGWFRRHCLWSCRNGGLLPNLVLRRFYDNIEISWTTDTPIGAPKDFVFQLTSGGIRLPVGDVAVPLHQFLVHATKYVAEISNTNHARNLEEKVKAMSSSAKMEGRLAWLAGFGHNGVSRLKKFQAALFDDLAAALQKQTEKWFFPKPNEGLFIPGNCQGALMFGAQAPVLENVDRLEIAKKIAKHLTSAKRTDPLKDMVGKIHADDAWGEELEPWRQGYEIASRVEAQIPQKAGTVDVEGYLAKIGVEVDDISLTDKSTSGIAVASSERAPLILINDKCPRHIWSGARRFTIAHELCHLLVDREVGADLALASGPWAPRAVEQRANAFAAALLMPDWLILETFEEIGTHPSSCTFKDLQKASSALKVSKLALIEHLYNKLFIDEAKREQLREELQKNQWQE